jgi:hypothetical protein
VAPVPCVALFCLRNWTAIEVSSFSLIFLVLCLSVAGVQPQMVVWSFALGWCPMSKHYGIVVSCWSAIHLWAQPTLQSPRLRNRKIYKQVCHLWAKSSQNLAWGSSRMGILAYVCFGLLP